MDITKKHSTEIYKDGQHGHHQKNIAQKYIKMSNMDITKHIAKKYIKMSNMDINKKQSKEIYKDE